jgi:hypothetical protein
MKRGDDKRWWMVTPFDDDMGPGEEVLARTAEEAAEGWVEGRGTDPFDYVEVTCVRGAPGDGTWKADDGAQPVTVHVTPTVTWKGKVVVKS